MNTYNIGATIRIRGSFLDENGIPTDPGEIHFELMCPSKAKITYTYGVNPEVQKSDVGMYYMDIIGQSGFYCYRIYSDVGLISSSGENEFFVS